MKTSCSAVTRVPAPHAFSSRDPDSRGGSWEKRFQIDEYCDESLASTLAADVRRGLLAPQKTLSPKYFYDDRGAQLFDAICDLPEYYLTRTEQALLDRVADEIVHLARPTALFEFGSGASRKTRTLLDAMERAGCNLRYIPMDVSHGMLRQAARALLRDYPRLHVHAIVGDYESDLGRIPRGGRRLVLFLGSTIGNFTPRETHRFLTNVRRQLTTGDHLLLGVDLAKSVPILEAAYNDASGVTAAFNRNILRVINRCLAADFEPARFEHLAFFNDEQSQIEMHLRATTAHTASIRALDLSIAFAAGETIHTEISRKFSPADVQSVLAATGFQQIRWYTPPNESFGLALAHAA